MPGRLRAMTALAGVAADLLMIPKSADAIINWQGVDIGAGEQVDFN
jgi:hypothetical protein